MNERIKELYGEAVEYTSSQDDGTKNQLQMNHVCADKFAELIVKECARVAFESDLTMAIGQWGADSAILKHFGIEE